MSQQNKATNSLAPTELPVKRKRGRPRKDENLAHAVENVPIIPIVSDGAKKTQRIEVETSDNNTNDDMVGQPVSGVLEGSFDAGYFLSVKIANSDAPLRGVVFLPGRFAPITPANDVAPNAKLYKRKDIPIPVPTVQVPVAPQHAKVPVMIENQVPPTAQVPIAPSLAKLPDTFENQVPPTVEVSVAAPFVTIPLTDNIVKNDSSLLLGGEAMAQKPLEFEIEKQDEIMRDSGHETVTFKPLASDHKMDELVGGEVKIPVDIPTETLAAPKNDDSPVVNITEVAPLSEVKVAAEGTELPGNIVPQVCSTDSANKMDCDITDPILTSESQLGPMELNNVVGSESFLSNC